MSWGLVLNPNHPDTVKSLYDYHSAPHRLNSDPNSNVVAGPTAPGTKPSNTLSSFTDVQWNMLAPQQQQTLTSGYGTPNLRQVNVPHQPSPSDHSPSTFSGGMLNIRDQQFKWLGNQQWRDVNTGQVHTLDENKAVALLGEAARPAYHTQFSKSVSSPTDSRVSPLPAPPPPKQSSSIVAGPTPPNQGGGLLNNGGNNWNPVVGQGGSITGNITPGGSQSTQGSVAVNQNNVASWDAPQFKPAEMVERRLTELFEDGNPLLENARKRALEQYAGRGLLNSSMAQQGAMDAMMQTALPIATADAAAVNNVGMFNTELQTKSVQDYAAALNNWNTVQQALSKDQHSRYQDTLSKYQTMYQTEYNAVMMASNIDAATKNNMLADLESRYGAMYNSTNAIFARAPGWQESWLTVFGD